MINVWNVYREKRNKIEMLENTYSKGGRRTVAMT